MNEKIPSASMGIKVMYISIGVALIFTSLWTGKYGDHSMTENASFIASLAIIALGFFPFWIVIVYGATKLTRDGVEQRKFFFEGRFFTTTTIKWKDVRLAQYRNNVYKIVGSRGSVHVGAFMYPDPKKLYEFIDGSLPPGVPRLGG